jgi:hypothetical protein
MPKDIKGALVDLSCLDGEALQVAIRVAYNNLRDYRKTFDQFVKEAAPARILQYSYIYLLFAQMIVAELDEETDRRCGQARRA